VRKLMTWLSGADEEMLAVYPRERTWFTALGIAMIVTGGLASVSMWFFLHMALRLNAAAAIPCGLLWGVAIICVDHFLVVSMRGHGIGMVLLQGTPRVLMAILIGAIVSTPLTLQIFSSEINGQIPVIQQNRAASFLASLQHGNVQAQVTTWQDKVDALDATIANGGVEPTNPASDPQLKSLNSQLSATQQNAYTEYKDWECQLYGGPACPQKGDGQVAQSDHEQYEYYVSQVATLTSEIAAREKTLQDEAASSDQTRVNQARAALPTAQAGLTAAQAEENELRASFESANERIDGLLIRLQALDQLAANSWDVRFAWLGLSLLFFVFEILPVSVKVLRHFGRPTAYDAALKLADQQRETEFKQALTNSQAQVVDLLAKARVQAVRQGGTGQAWAGQPVTAQAVPWAGGGKPTTAKPARTRGPRVIRRGRTRPANAASPPPRTPVSGHPVPAPNGPVLQQFQPSQGAQAANGQVPGSNGQSPGPGTP
jgi:hypothetical protein